MDHKRQLAALSGFFREIADRFAEFSGIRKRGAFRSRVRIFAIFSILLSIGFVAGFVLISVAFADDALPKPQNLWLPFESNGSDNNAARTISSVVREIVKYVGVLAVIALTYGGFLFMTSFGDEEKVKKAKGIVKFSIIGVILSITAYSIIDIVNELRI